MTITHPPTPSPTVLPPSSYLPPIKTLASQPLPALLDALHYLRTLYAPIVRGSPRPIPALNTDPFERAHAIRWLTALVRAAAADPALEDITCAAAALLALCAGPASAGTLTRTFVFPTPGAGAELSVQLTDVPLENGDFGSVGAQTWGGACVLADRLARAPARFLPPAALTGTGNGNGTGVESGVGAAAAPLRALELGAGTGLVSLALGKLLQHRAQPATLLATDVHPSVLSNLRANIAANFPPPSADSPVSVSAAFLDWAHPAALAADPFDLVLGADIVYEPVHATWIRAVLAQHLRRAPSARFHLVVPLRPTHLAEARSVEEVFPVAGATVGAAFEPELCITSREVVECDGEGEGETRYYYYVIEWV